MIPVSIRTRNPGAMWPGDIATKFGSTSHEDLKDGNKAAIFPTFEQGGAAQFALWSRSYSGMTLQAAILKWSGHNSSQEYANSLRQKTGISFGTVITRAFLAGPDGRKFMAAQAQWEAGQPYPMTDAQWQQAQNIAFGSAPATPIPPPSSPPPKEPPAASPSLWALLLSSLFGRRS